MYIYIFHPHIFYHFTFPGLYIYTMITHFPLVYYLNIRTSFKAVEFAGAFFKLNIMVYPVEFRALANFRRTEAHEGLMPRVLSNTNIVSNDRILISHHSSSLPVEANFISHIPFLLRRSSWCLEFIVESRSLQISQ